MVLCLLHYYAVPIGKEHARQSRRGTHRDYTLAIGYLEPTTHFVPIQATREQEEAPAAAKRSGIHCSPHGTPAGHRIISAKQRMKTSDLRSIPTRSFSPSGTAKQSLYCRLDAQQETTGRCYLIRCSALSTEQRIRTKQKRVGHSPKKAPHTNPYITQLLYRNAIRTHG